MALLSGKTPPSSSPRDASDVPAETRRRRDPEATRLAILEAAENLFIDHGPAATSLRRIARDAGVTKSLIHHHFGSKEDLFGEVQQRHFRLYYETQKQMLSEAGADTGSGTGDLLENSLVAYFRFLQEHPKSVRFHTWSLATCEHCATKPEKELFELGVQRIREAQSRGEIRADLEPFFIIKAMIALPMSWFQTREETLSLLGSEADPVDPEALDEQYLRDVVRIFLDGIRPRAEVDRQSRPDAQTDPTGAGATGR